MTYKQKYDNLIKENQDRKDDNITDYEIHHIKPRSIYKDLINDKSNLVKLSLNDHIKAHIYLYYYYKNELKNIKYAMSMAIAVSMMINIHIEELQNTLTEDEINYYSKVYNDCKKLSKESIRVKLKYYALNIAKSNRPILQYDSDGNFIKEWNGVKEASKALNIKSPAIRRVLNNKRIKTKGYIWKYKLSENYPLKINVREGLNVKKQILQYTLDGQFVREWDSIAEARTKTGINGIAFSICGKRHSAGGFIWRYKTNNYQNTISVDKFRLNIKKKILCKSIDGTFQKEFIGINEAAKELGILRQGISKCLSGKYHSTYGYIFIEVNN